MKGYKAFKKGLICDPTGKNSFQYAEDTVFETDTAELCKSVFHFCKNPLDVFNYYPLVDNDGNMTEFAEVEALDDVKTNNIKYCTKKLKIGKKISFSTLIQASINFEMENKPTKNIKIRTENKDRINISSNNNSVIISSSGNSVKINSNGKDVIISSSGDSVKINNSGDWAKIDNSGNWAKINSNGKCAQISNSGNNIRINSSGNNIKISSSGDYAKICSNGNFARITSNGKGSIICCTGHNSIAKGKAGNWIILSEWAYNEEEEASFPICVKAEFVDGERIKEDTFYKLENGNFVEVK